MYGVLIWLGKVDMNWSSTSGAQLLVGSMPFQKAIWQTGTPEAPNRRKPLRRDGSWRGFSGRGRTPITANGVTPHKAPPCLWISLHNPVDKSGSFLMGVALRGP